MADYCKQCSEHIFGRDFGDFDTLLEGTTYLRAKVLCEGCGPTIVDAKGNCINPDCLCKHGNIDLKHYESN